MPNAPLESANSLHEDGAETIAIDADQPIDLAIA